MVTKDINILIIEDNPGDARLIELILEQSFGDMCKMSHRERIHEGISELENGIYDIVLLDLNLPDSNGLDTLKRYRESETGVPVIILTGLNDHQTGIEAIKQGAEDYLVKDNLDIQVIQKSIFYSIERFNIKKELEIKTSEVEQKREQLDLILNKMFDAVLIVDDKGFIRYLNKSAKSLFKSDKNELLNTRFDHFNNSEGLSEICIGENNETICEMHLSKISWEGKTMFIATIRDITKRKIAENNLKEQYRFLNTVLDSLTYPFYVINIADYTIEILNTNPGHSTSSKPSYCYQLFHNRDDPCDDEEHPCPLEEVIRTRQPVTSEHIHLDNAGKRSIVEVHLYPIIDSDDTIRQVIEYSLDITERKKAEDQIRTSLKEKDVLLKEIHHRVKNNLQIISSMLWLQQRNLINEQDRMYFNDCRHRIKAMSIIYEKLYQSENFARVNFIQFIENLIYELKLSYSIKDNVEFKVDPGNSLINLNAAIPLSQIITELITNSIKYAFPDDRKGIIEIELKEDKSKFHLTINDNGVGFPEDFHYPGTESIGLNLIDALVKQIHGTLEYKNDNGTRYKITFKNEK